MAVFSVLMSVYSGDKPQFLKQAFDSIFNQILKPAEVILVKDGELTADLNAMIQEYNEKYAELRVFELASNSGLGVALNYGLYFCTSELVARMDADDIAVSDRFEKQIPFLESRPDIAVLGGHIYEFQNDPGDLNKQKKVPIAYEDVVRFAKLRNPINHPTVVFRKSAVLAVGSYKHMPLFEDYYLWLRLLKAGYKIENMDHPVLHFRLTNMLKRRHGLAYFKKEIHFFSTLYKEGLIPKEQYLLMLTIRLPFRILPRKVLALIYDNLLREGGFISRKLKRP